MKVFLLSSILLQPPDPFNVVRPCLLNWLTSSRFQRSSTIQIFQVPSLVTMSIVATRMHRSLIDFVSESTEMFDILPSSLVSALIMVGTILAYRRALKLVVT